MVVCVQICIIDDQPNITKPLALLLQYHGFGVTVYDNGLDALQGLDRCEHLPAVIVVDYMMPVMDGFEFRKRQKATPRIADIPTFLFTASAAHIANPGIGFDLQLQKPISAKDLVATIKTFFGSLPESVS